MAGVEKHIVESRADNTTEGHDDRILPDEGDVLIEGSILDATSARRFTSLSASCKFPKRSP